MNPFDIIDRICLINLPERTDRLMDSIYECEKIGIKSRVEVVEGIKSGHRGLIETNIYIFDSTDNETVMILQDDVKFINNPVKTFTQAIEQLKYEEWDMIYLGALVKQRLIKVYPNWFRLRYGYCLHAAIYNKRIIPVVRSIFNSHLNKPTVDDRLIVEYIQPYYRCLLIDPMIAVQRPEFSDLEGKQVDYDIERRFINVQSYGRNR